MTAATVRTDISTETNTAAQEGVKINMPALPDAFGESQLLELYTKAEKEAKAEVPDVTTQEGRKNIKDMARKVAASNKAVDTPMRDYLRMIKAQPKVLEKNARESKARFDTLKAEILKPLEDAQADQDEIIGWLNGCVLACSQPAITSEILKSDLETINGYTAEGIWPELKKKFKVAHESALTTVTTTLERIEEAEKQAARLAELEAQAEEQRQKDHDREVAEAAAEKARVEAEAKAEKDRADIERRAVEAKQAEEAAKQEAIKAKRDAEIAEQKRIDDAAAAEERRKQDAIDAEARQAEAVKKAREYAAKPVVTAPTLTKSDTPLAGDKKHRVDVNLKAIEALIEQGLSKDSARVAVLAIRDDKVPNVSIRY